MDQEHHGYYQAGAFVGGLIAIFLVSRVILWVFASLGDNEMRIVIAHVVTLVIAVSLVGYRLAGAGAPQFENALEVYALAAAFWLAVDLVRLKGRRASRET